MFSKKALLVCLALGISASSAMAAPAPGLPLPMYGSDTLFDITSDVIKDANCPAGVLTPNISYKGTGSGQAGKAMGPGDTTVNPVIPPQNQQVGPQSRFMNATECSAISSNAGQGITVGLDGIGISGDSTTCHTLRYTGNLGSTPDFTFQDWRDVLRLLYAGQIAPVPVDPCSQNDPPTVPSTPGTLVGRCDRPERVALIANFHNIFEGGCSTGKCTGALRHAFRRDDVSGTTDTFVTLLGLPKPTVRTFCDGFDNEDLDPERVSCDANEQVCSNTIYSQRNASPEGAAPPGAAKGLPSSSASGDLGVVLAVTMPTDTTKQFQAICPSPIGGAFRRAPMPFAITNEEKRCPDGLGPKLGCLWPATSTTGTFCLARKANIPGVRHADFQFMDGRGYNQVPRDPSTGAILLPSSSAQIPDPRWGGGGFYKLHQTAAMANGTGTCTQSDATRQIGCLVTADPCSIGYAGKESVSAFSTTVQAFALRSPLNDATHPARVIDDTDDNVRLLLNPSGQAGDACGHSSVSSDNGNFGYRYPLARKLWIDSSKGLGIVPNPGSAPTFTNIANTVTDSSSNPLNTREKDFAQCMANRAITDQYVVAHGFITVSSNNCSTTSCAADELDYNYRARTCAAARCGDGILDPTEACDDGNTVGGDSCAADCSSALNGSGTPIASGTPCASGSDSLCGGKNVDDTCGTIGTCVAAQSGACFCTSERQ